jgi:hypothetical protein
MSCRQLHLQIQGLFSSSKLSFKEKSVLMIAQPYFYISLTSLRKYLAVSLLAGFAIFASTGFSQTAQTSPPLGQAPKPPAATNTKTDPANPKKKGDAKSGWSKLTPAQQKALQPLARSWDPLSAGQQRKWLEVSRNYHSLSDVDKANMHSRMAAWAALSNRERAEARLNFATTNELSHELTAAEKKAKWDAYQSLSAEEKKKLAATGPRPPTGAATPIRPVAQRKLATLPATAAVAAKPPKMPADSTAGSDSTVTTDH